MPGDSGNPSDNGANGAAVDMAAIQKMIEEGVGKALAARLPRVKNTEETLAKMVSDTVAKALEGIKPVEPKPEGGNDAGPERQTLKSLTEELGRMRKQLAEQQAAAESASKQARDERVRSQLQAKFAAKLGADNPITGTLIDSLYDVKKRVVEQDGRLFVKFTDNFGGEDLKPIDEGVSALFDTEFKHLVASPSKANGLPPVSMVRGQQMGQPGGNNAPRNPIYAEIAKSALGENPNLAALLNNAGNNSSSK